jgi:hypothetical protein
VAEDDLRACDKIVRFVEPRRAWFFALALLLLALGFNGQWRIEPDGALYLSLARNIAEGAGYVYHGQPHRLAFPGLPYLIAGTFKLFGIGQLVPIHVVLWLMSVAALALTYRLILLHKDRQTAAVVTFITAVSYTFFSFAFQLRNDMPFLVGVLAFLCGWEAVFYRPGRRWYDWVLLVGGLGLAIVMRPAMWALVGAILLTLIVQMFRGGQVKRSAITVAVVLGAAALFFVMDPRRDSARLVGDYEDQTVAALGEGVRMSLQTIVVQNAPVMFGPIAAETMLGHEAGPVLNQILGIAAVLAGVLLIRERLLWGLWIVLTVLMMLKFLPQDAILPRDFLPVFPLLVYACWQGVSWLNRALPRPWDWVAVVLIVGWMTMNGLKIGELIIEQRSTPFYAHYKHGHYLRVLEMARHIERTVEPDRIVLAQAKTGRILSYYSRRNVVDTWEVPAFDPHPHVYVIQPIDEPVANVLRSLNLSVAHGRLAEVDGPDDTVYTLRRAVPRAGAATRPADRSGAP